MVACWAGPLDQGERALQPFHDVAPVVAEHLGPMPYPALNSAFDALVPPGLQHYWKANFVTELTDEAIAAHLEHGPKVPVVNSTVHIYPINGACHRVAPDATAFAYRDANFATVIAGMWPDPAQNQANIRWVRDYYDATAPLSEEGGYINFMADDDQDRIKANYRGNYERLVRSSASTTPTTSSTSTRTSDPRHRPQLHKSPLSWRREPAGCAGYTATMATGPIRTMDLAPIAVLSRVFAGREAP